MAQWEAPETFADFVRSRHGELLRFAYALTGDRHVAEDLVQDALERAGISWRQILRKDEPEGYVRRIIINRHLNRARSLKRERIVADVPEHGYAPSADPVDERIWRLLADLPRQQRTVLVLRFFLDLSELQVAEALGCSVGAVKSNSSRALAKLRAALLAQDLTVRGDGR